MSNVIKFDPDAPDPVAVHLEDTTATVPPVGSGMLMKTVKALLYVVWLVVAITFPLVKWIVSLVAFWHLLRTFVYWDTPGVYAGWEFLAWFGALVALTAFVAYGAKER